MLFVLGARMGGRGRGSAGNQIKADNVRTPEQNKTIERLVKRTARLKNEQYRIIDQNGNVLLEKQGTRGEVSHSVGESRDNLPAAISIHNHPEGGTFSTADLKDFAYGAKEIVVSAPEGEYRLINAKWNNPKERYNGWFEMREDMIAKGLDNENRSAIGLLQQARDNMANTPTVQKMQAMTARWDAMRKEQGTQAANEWFKAQNAEYERLRGVHALEVEGERRRLETQPYHDYYMANAKKYGFIYIAPDQSKIEGYYWKKRV